MFSCFHFTETPSFFNDICEEIGCSCRRRKLIQKLDGTKPNECRHSSAAFFGGTKLAGAIARNIMTEQKIAVLEERAEVAVIKRTGRYHRRYVASRRKLKSIL